MKVCLSAGGCCRYNREGDKNFPRCEDWREGAKKKKGLFGEGAGRDIPKSGGIFASFAIIKFIGKE